MKNLVPKGPGGMSFTVLDPGYPAHAATPSIWLGGCDFAIAWAATDWVLVADRRYTEAQLEARCATKTQVR